MLHMEISGKVAVITGASMGIGEAIAKLFVERGAKVVLLSRDVTRAEAARQRIGRLDQTKALACDVRRPEEIEQVVSATVGQFSRIDVWVNNAGHGLRDSVAHMDREQYRQMFETNLFGTISAMQAVVPIMEKQGGGTIINISSVAGHIPLPFSAAYSATKFAMNAIGKAARVELKSAGIHVLTVCPGFVRTEFAANALKGKQVPQVRPNSARGVTAERVARATLDGYRKQKREVVVPWTMLPVIKLYQMFPGLVETAIQRMVRRNFSAKPN
jgi:short-subunit dehydrogenase